MLSRGLQTTSRSATVAGRRHLAVAAPRAVVNGDHGEAATAPTRYMPETALGRYYVEQKNEHWRSAVAAQSFQKGAVIGSAPGELFKTPNRWTIQLEADKHLEFHGGLEFVNHSCAPNTKILVSETAEEIAFVATRDIEEGEHLSFDYTTSEWDMDEKFDCLCGAPNCRHHIGGAKYLSDKEVEARIGMFTPSVLRQLLDKKITQ